MKIEVTAHLADEDHELFVELLHSNRTLIERLKAMSQQSDALLAAIAAEKTVVAGAVTFINGVPAVIAAAVQKALSDAGVDDTTTQTAVASATNDAQQMTADLRAALVQGTPEQGTPGTDSSSSVPPVAAPPSTSVQS